VLLKQKEKTQGKIELEDIMMLMYLDKVIYFASKRVGHLVQQQQDKLQVSKLQDALMIIQQVLGNQSHHLGLMLLDYFTELEHGSISNKEKEKILKEIKSIRTTLKNFTAYLTKLERDFNSTLTIEGEKKEIQDKIKTVHDKIKTVQDWMLKNKIII